MNVIGYGTVHSWYWQHFQALELCLEPKCCLTRNCRCVNMSCVWQRHVFRLRHLCSVCQHVVCDITAKLVSAFVLSWLDATSVILAGLPMTTTLASVQRVLNAAARTDQETVWLLPFRNYTGFQSLLGSSTNPCLPAHKTVVGHAPWYIVDLLSTDASCRNPSLLRVSTHGNFAVWWLRPKIGECAFSVAALRV